MIGQEFLANHRQGRPFYAKRRDRMQQQLIQVDLVINQSKSKYWNTHYNIIQSLLIQEGKESWDEQQVLLQPIDYRCNIRTFPCHWFTRFQKLYAHLRLNPDDKNNENISIDNDSENCIDEAMDQFPESHILCHASEGYFIPVNFHGHPLFDTTLPGGWVGSSYRLMDELLEMSITLGITLTPLKGTVRRGGGYDLSSHSIENLNQTEDSHIYAKERRVWFSLYDAAKISQKSNTSITLKP